MINEKIKDEMENKAYNCLKKYGYKLDAPIDITELATNMGFTVGSTELPNSLDGFIIVDNQKQLLQNIDTNMLIAVNEDRTEENIRFIIAHELAHYINEYNEQKLFACREQHKEGHPRPESEDCNDFLAACLLMPSEAVKEYHTYLVNSDEINEKDELNITKKIASYFNVELNCAKRRINEVIV